MTNAFWSTNIMIVVFFIGYGKSVDFHDPSSTTATSLKNKNDFVLKFLKFQQKNVKSIIDVVQNKSTSNRTLHRLEDYILTPLVHDLGIHCLIDAHKICFNDLSEKPINTVEREIKILERDISTLKKREISPVEREWNEKPIHTVEGEINTFNREWSESHINRVQKEGNEEPIHTFEKEWSEETFNTIEKPSNIFDPLIQDILHSNQYSFLNPTTKEFSEEFSDKNHILRDLHFKGNEENEDVTVARTHLLESTNVDSSLHHHPYHPNDPSHHHSYDPSHHHPDYHDHHPNHHHDHHPNHHHDHHRHKQHHRKHKKHSHHYHHHGARLSSFLRICLWRHRGDISTVCLKRLLKTNPHNKKPEWKERNKRHDWNVQDEFIQNNENFHDSTSNENSAHYEDQSIRRKEDSHDSTNTDVHPMRMQSPQVVHSVATELHQLPQYQTPFHDTATFHIQQLQDSMDSYDENHMASYKKQNLTKFGLLGIAAGATGALLVLGIFGMCKLWRSWRSNRTQSKRMGYSNLYSPSAIVHGEAVYEPLNPNSSEM